MNTLTHSGVGVLDKSLSLLAAVERGARSLSDIVTATGLSRATAHRLAAALETQGLLARDEPGRWKLGLRLFSLGSAAVRAFPISEAARPALTTLRTATGESAQLYVREHDRRLCIAAVESTSGLRTIVHEGSSLPLTAGSAGKVFMAWAPHTERERLISSVERLTPATPTDPDALRGELARIRERGWAESVGEREVGVASVSAPVLDAGGDAVAVVSVSGPVERTGTSPGTLYAPEVVAAARAVEAALGSA